MTSRGFRDIIFHSVVVFDLGENWSMASHPNKNSECGIHRHRGEIKLLRKRPWCDDQRHGGACVLHLENADFALYQPFFTAGYDHPQPVQSAELESVQLCDESSGQF